jgi:hypothetical protein
MSAFTMNIFISVLLHQIKFQIIETKVTFHITSDTLMLQI